MHHVLRGALRRAGRGVTVVVLVGVEVAALATWLSLATGASSPLAPLATGTLAAGLFVRTVLAYLAVGRLGSVAPPMLAAMAVGATVPWVGWLWLAARLGDVGGALVAGLALAGVLVALRAAEVRLLRHGTLGPLLVDRPVLSAGVLQAAGATAWLLLGTDAVAAHPALLAVVGQFGASVPAGGSNGAVGLGALAAAVLVSRVLVLRQALRPGDRAAAIRWAAGTPRQE